MSRQTNFSGGELDPLLHGRTDLDLYKVGLRTCLNFIITKTGAAMSRPGSTFVSELKYPDPSDVDPPADLPDSAGVDPLADYGKVKLFGFVASDSLSYVLEFTHHAIRFYADGGKLLNAGNHYEVLNYTTGAGIDVHLPWSFADLKHIRVAQIGDVLIVVGSRFPAIELRRLGHTNWSARELPLSRPAPVFADVGGTGTKTTNFAFVSAVAGTHGDTVDPDHPAREWKWMVTQLVQDEETGEKYETYGELVTRMWDGTTWGTTNQALSDNNAAVYPDGALTLKRADPGTPLDDPPFRVLGYNIYRGRGNLFGFIGTTTTREFVDVGAEPNYARQPPLGTYPFEIGDLRDCPSSVTHFQSKRWFGGTGLLLGEGDDPFRREHRPQTLFASATEDFANFDGAPVLNFPGQSLKFDLASNVREQIRHLVSQRALLVGTASSWWKVSGGQGQPVDYNHIEAERIDEVGVGNVRPLEVEKSVLFVRTKGVGARALVSNGENYEPVDISAQARHLFEGEGKRLVDWAFAEDPWGVVWAVREDGVLLSLTFSRNGVAWARHETDGEVEAVCCVPEGDEDGVYIAVRREVMGVDDSGAPTGLTQKRYIERLTSRHPRGGAVVLAGDVLDRPMDFVCVDSAVPYVGDAVSTFTGLDHLEGKEVYVLAEGHPVTGPFTVEGGEVDVGEELEARTLREDGVARLVAYVGLGYECDLELLDVAGAEARLRHKQVSHVLFEVDQTKGIAVGQDFDHLNVRPSREVSDAFAPPVNQTAVVKCPIRGHSNLSARAVIRQTLPLPATVVGIQRRLVMGEG